jgi:NAD/NADP transhydrogenase alpha subunit
MRRADAIALKPATPALREQVQSLGAEFVEVDFQEDGAGQGGYAKEMSKAIALKPATPAPITRTLLGGIFPAAVT